MTIIVHGATGAQGAPVAAALTRNGHHVTAAVRTPGTAAGSAAIALDLTDAAALTRAYDGAEGIFVHLPLGAPDQQLTQARAIVAAVAAARPRRVVISTSGMPIDGDSPVGVLVEGVEATGVSTAVIAPRLYLENLLLPPVVEGVRAEGVLRYPIRADYAVSWASHLDIADAAARLFADHDVTGVVGVGAIPGLLGDDLARGFAEHVGRDVRFEAQDPDVFGATIEPLFGAAGTAPVVASYHWRATQPDELIDAATSARERFGLTPRTVAQWLADLQV